MGGEGESMELELFDETVVVDAAAVDATPDAIRRQVSEYERGERRAFDALATAPTPFVGRVMDAIADIPFGEKRTYGDLAAALETAPVAVGQACGRNPAPILVPCHRVVASDGSLTGYSAPGGVALKRALLDHERSVAGETAGADDPATEEE